jgi:hypothetical protein
MYGPGGADMSAVYVRDPQTIALLRFYQRSDDTVKHAPLVSLSCVADEGMPMNEAARLYWMDRGLSNTDAPGMVKCLTADPPDCCELFGLTHPPQSRSGPGPLRERRPFSLWC